MHCLKFTNTFYLINLVVNLISTKWISYIFEFFDIYLFLVFSNKQGAANPSPPIKSDFENIFPFNFSESDIDDEMVDKIVNPDDGDYVGIDCDESGVFISF